MFYTQLFNVLFCRYCRFMLIFLIFVNVFILHSGVSGLSDSETLPHLSAWRYTPHNKIRRTIDYNVVNDIIDDNAEDGVAIDRIPLKQKNISSTTTFNSILDVTGSIKKNRKAAKSRQRRWKVESLALLSSEVLTTDPTTSPATLPPTKLNSDRQFRADGNNHTSNHYSPCENNGAFVNGKCQCYYPYMGVRCTDFACEHGLSVGPRYDPESVFFNRKCICDEDWAGELCNIPIADQCNERGQYIRGRCKCHGYYFGPKCQYVGKCTNGKLLEGICVCNYGYEGDYCDKIVCHHGYRDKSNDSNSCVCPPRHSGIFCDECMLTGDYILPFPNCTEEKIPHRARVSREKTDDQIIARLFIIGLILLMLALMASAMFFLHWGRERAAHYDSIGQHCEMVRERKETLERAICLQATGNPLTADYMFLGSSANGNGNRRGSRFADPLRLEHDLL